MDDTGYVRSNLAEPPGLISDSPSKFGQFDFHNLHGIYTIIRMEQNIGPSLKLLKSRLLSQFFERFVPSLGNKMATDKFQQNSDWAKILDNRRQVDTFILDFEKAFDTPPHELLKSKFFSYGIGGKTLKWIDSFLCFRRQRVVVYGVKSDWASVLSGVLQGTVLGPLLFSLYINDISSDIESEIRLFADDCVCYREIKDEVDTMKLQRAIDRLGS